MSYDKLLTAEPGVWTITLTQNSRTASVAGVLLVTAGAREGDAVLDDEGRILVIKALTETEVTLAWPYKAATRTIDLVVEQRSINRAINTASSTAAIAALTRLQNAADLAPNYPVLSHGNTPPAAPADGDRHLVGIDPIGLWAGRAEHLALYSAATGKWSFTPPADGMSVVLAGTSARLQYNGTAWDLDALGANGGRLSGPLDWASAIDVASTSIVDLGAARSNLVNITGTMAITSFGAAANGVWRLVRFAGALTLTHGTSLALPTGANIATAAGDWALFVSRGSGTWHCASYDRADGTPLALGAGVVGTARLADAAVSNAKLADMATAHLKGRMSASNGMPEDLSKSQVLDLLGLPSIKNLQRQIFTSSGAFVAPTGTLAATAFKLTVTGGGGGGMGGQAGNVMGAGGGAGATIFVWLTGLTAGASYAVTVGLGGAEGAADGGSGGTGGASSFAAPSGTCTAGGGAGGSVGSGGLGSIAGCANFDMALPGGDGADSTLPSTSWLSAGKGGSSFWGGGGKGGTGFPGSAGRSGGAYGAGGGGGMANTNIAAQGGAGAPGVVIIEWVL